MIEIWEPRYRDKTVLVANYKIPTSGNLELRITKGYYAGEYTVDEEVAFNCPIEQMGTKSGGTIDVRVIPLDKLKKKEAHEGEDKL